MKKNQHHICCFDSLITLLSAIHMRIGAYEFFFLCMSELLCIWKILHLIHRVNINKQTIIFPYFRCVANKFKCIKQNKTNYNILRFNSNRAFMYFQITSIVILI